MSTSILTPRDAAGFFSKAMSAVHRAYAGHINARRKKTGHFWQGRFGCVARLRIRTSCWWQPCAMVLLAVGGGEALRDKLPQHWQWLSARADLQRPRRRPHRDRRDAGTMPRHEIVCSLEVRNYRWQRCCCAALRASGAPRQGRRSWRGSNGNWPVSPTRRNAGQSLADRKRRAHVTVMPAHNRLPYHYNYKRRQGRVTTRNFRMLLAVLCSLSC